MNTVTVWLGAALARNVMLLEVAFMDRMTAIKFAPRRLTELSRQRFVGGQQHRRLVWTAQCTSAHLTPFRRNSLRHPQIRLHVEGFGILHEVFKLDTVLGRKNALGAGRCFCLWVAPGACVLLPFISWRKAMVMRKAGVVRYLGSTSAYKSVAHFPAVARP